jgi:hypothetical protein
VAWGLVTAALLAIAAYGLVKTPRLGPFGPVVVSLAGALALLSLERTGVSFAGLLRAKTGLDALRK